MQQSYWTPLPEENARAHAPADYYPWFDGLRMALAIAVLLAYDGFIDWDRATSLAIDVFFALSGWLIGGILLKVRPSNLPRFFFNRAVRIWVPYYLALALLVAIGLARENVPARWAEFMAYKALMVWNLFGADSLAAFRTSASLQEPGSHFWYVNAEEQFYLLAPLLLVLAPGWGRSILVWTLLAIGALVAGIYPAIVLGVLAALLAERWPRFQLQQAVRLGLVAVLLACVLAMASELAFEGASALAALTVVLLLAVPGKATPLGRLLSGVSYPLYLNHWIGVLAAKTLLLPYGLQASGLRPFVACAISLLLAIVLYWWTDRRLLAHRSQWFSPLRGVMVMALAYVMVCAGLLLGVFMRP